MTKEELAREIYRSSHLTGTFVLRSGTVSHEYFDKYQFESDPVLLAEIARQMIPLLPEGYDLITGLEMGGIPIATALSLQTGKAAAFCRKKAKEYGTAKLAEGPVISGRKIVVIEDVVTSGGQVVISSGELREAGAELSVALCVIDREAGGRRALAEKGIELRPLFTMSEIKNIVGV